MKTICISARITTNVSNEKINQVQVNISQSIIQFDVRTYDRRIVLRIYQHLGIDLHRDIH